MGGSGLVLLARTYAPFGILLAQEGSGASLFGYAGGQAGVSNLWYFGSGYFDPQTGQFLAQETNPLAPLAASVLANPGGLLFGPLLLWNWRRRKKGGKLPPTGLFVLALLFTVGLVGCENDDDTPTKPPIIDNAPVTGPEMGSTPKPTTQYSEPGVGQSGETESIEIDICRTPTSTKSTSTIEEPATATPIPTDEPPSTIVILFSGIGEDMNFDGPEPHIQTNVWWQKAGDSNTDESRNAHSYKFRANPGGKNMQANNAMAKYEAHYKDANLRIIGYSAGADSALLFAHRYYQKQKGSNGGTGEILSIALLGPTMTDNVQGSEYQESRGFIGTNNNWITIMNNLLLEGTDIYLLNDSAPAEPFTNDKPENNEIKWWNYVTAEFETYIPPEVSDTTGRFKYDVRPEYPHIGGYDPDDGTPIGAIGANTDSGLVDHVFDWFYNN